MMESIFALELPPSPQISQVQNEIAAYFPYHNTRHYAQYAYLRWQFKKERRKGGIQLEFRV